ncbi:MAG: hypothetical protein WCJ61_12175, partial [Paludibacter sp.]
MDMDYYNLVFIIAGIIQGIVIGLFILLFFIVKSISKENVKQTRLLIAIADKQGALTKTKCPYCDKNIIIELFDENGVQKCYHCKNLINIENDRIEKRAIHRINCVGCSREIFTSEPIE